MVHPPNTHTHYFYFYSFFVTVIYFLSDILKYDICIMYTLGLVDLETSIANAPFSF